MAELSQHFNDLPLNASCKVENILPEWDTLKTHMLPVIKNNTKATYLDLKNYFYEWGYSKSCPDVPNFDTKENIDYWFGERMRSLTSRTHRYPEKRKRLASVYVLFVFVTLIKHCTFTANIISYFIFKKAFHFQATVSFSINILKPSC